MLNLAYHDDHSGVVKKHLKKRTVNGDLIDRKESALGRTSCVWVFDSRFATEVILVFLKLCLKINLQRHDWQFWNTVVQASWWIRDTLSVTPSSQRWPQCICMCTCMCACTRNIMGFISSQCYRRKSEGGRDFIFFPSQRDVVDRECMTSVSNLYKTVLWAWPWRRELFLRCIRHNYLLMGNIWYFQINLVKWNLPWPSTSCLQGKRICQKLAPQLSSDILYSFQGVFFFNEIWLP